MHDQESGASGEVTFDLNEEPDEGTAWAKARRWEGSVCLRNSKESRVGRVTFYKSSGDFFVCLFFYPLVQVLGVKGRRFYSSKSSLNLFSFLLWTSYLPRTFDGAPLALCKT